MRRLLPCLVLAAACASGSPALTSPLPAPIDVTARAAEDTSDDAAIARAAREYLELETSIYPEHATQLGIHTADTELDDRSLEAEARGLAREETMARDLKARFAAIKAPRAARTDLAVLQHLLTADVRSKRELRPLERQPDVYTDPMNAIFLMLARDYAPAQERAKNALARAGGRASTQRSAALPSPTPTTPPSSRRSCCHGPPASSRPASRSSNFWCTRATSSRTTSTASTPWGRRSSPGPTRR